MLEIEVATVDGNVVCRPKGSLDSTTVSTFRGAIAPFLGEPGLVIDLSGVRFIDGAGLTAVVGTIRRAQGRRTRVAVVAPAGTIRSVLDEAGLEMIVSLLETVDLALARFQPERRSR